MIRSGCYRSGLVFLLLLALLSGTGGRPVDAAQVERHAGLVVDFGDGRVVVRVVSFSEETISGVDLLLRSGLDVALLPGWGAGTAVCAIEGVGCPPTPQECFCQCRGQDCRYWSYFHLQEGRWVYAPLGAGDHRLADGDVDGWVWGDGRTPPPLLTWEEIWERVRPAEPTDTPPPPTATPAPLEATPTPPAPTATASPRVVAPPEETATPEATVPSSPSPTPTEIPATLPATAFPVEAAPTAVPGSAGADVPAGQPGAITPAGALAFGAMVLLLAGLWLWVRRRR